MSTTKTNVNVIDAATAAAHTAHTQQACRAIKEATKKAPKKATKKAPKKAPMFAQLDFIRLSDHVINTIPALESAVRSSAIAACWTPTGVAEGKALDASLALCDSIDVISKSLTEAINLGGGMRIDKDTAAGLGIDEDPDTYTLAMHASRLRGLLRGTNKIDKAWGRAQKAALKA